MKTIIKSGGWSEITTKNINITSEPTKPFMTVEKWIESNKKIKLYHKRKSCNCCKTKWEKLTGYVYLIFTDKGNKTVCENCLPKLIDKKGSQSTQISDIVNIIVNKPT
jgi:hypothetical protein